MRLISVLNGAKCLYNFRAMSSASNRDQFLKQFEQIVEGVKQNRAKVRSNWGVFLYFRLTYNATCHRMLTSKVWMNDSRLLQESNLTAWQPRRAPHHIIQATTSERLAHRPYVAARLGFEPATLQKQNTKPPPLSHNFRCLILGIFLCIFRLL